MSTFLYMPLPDYTYRQSHNKKGENSVIEIDRCVEMIADAKYPYYPTLKIYYMIRLQTKLNHFAEEHHIPRCERPKCVALLAAAEICGIM